MEQRHYHCHLCRREHPDRHDYFARYEQLERHFEEKHFPCMFERCRADKFVVFAGEGELKRHTAQEHGDELSMTRSQRRAAMTVEAGFRSAPVPRVRRRTTLCEGRHFGGTLCSCERVWHAAGRRATRLAWARET